MPTKSPKYSVVGMDDTKNDAKNITYKQKYSKKSQFILNCHKKS